MNSFHQWYHNLSENVVGAEVKFVLHPVGDAIMDGLVYVATVLTDVLPEIGAGVVVVCAIEIMLTGNIPKWLGRMAVGVGGAIIWLLNA